MSFAFSTLLRLRAPALAFALALLGASSSPTPLWAQPLVVPPTVAYVPHGSPTAADELPVSLAPPKPDAPSLFPTAEEWPVLIVMPFTGALGAQAFGSPEGWGRTWDGYGNRLGDQVGFLFIEEGVRRALERVLPPTAPRASCWRAERSAAANLTAGSGCALWSTVAVRPASGDGWRFNAPMTVSLLAATGTSLAWRPERAEASTARSFLLSRTAIVFGGMAAGRLYDDWRSRPRAGER